MSENTFVVAALYCFTPVHDPAGLKSALELLCGEHQLCGTLLVAHEGINGTVAGRRSGIDALHTFLQNDGRFAALSYKESSATSTPFLRMKVRLKKEIVSLKQPGVSPIHQVGTYVSPKEWNALISDPDVLVLDTRNDYEVNIGTFAHAVDPNTKAFSDFPAFVKQHLDPKTHKKVAMFCTGGIRCEKASSYMMSQGFESVYHLQGGILKYLEEVPQEDSLWQGACFVFDGRVAVEHDLRETPHTLCFSCRMPLTPDDRTHAQYVEGVQCHHCAQVRSDEQKKSAEQRHKQVQHAKRQHRAHLGPTAMSKDHQRVAS